MKFFRAVALIALLAGPAYAQSLPDINIIPQERSKTPEEIEQDKVRDKAYRDSLRKIPDAKAPTDPWGGVRSADTPKDATKDTTRPQKSTQTKPRTKTGSTAN
jgi:hypothetical protein